MIEEEEDFLNPMESGVTNEMIEQQTERIEDRSQIRRQKDNPYMKYVGEGSITNRS